ncbi:hypothetical protein JNK13_02920 [bacterium]|nr:hypothetical protein [bacterium]
MYDINSPERESQSFLSPFSLADLEVIGELLARFWKRQYVKLLHRFNPKVYSVVCVIEGQSFNEGRDVTGGSYLVISARKFSIRRELKRRQIVPLVILQSHLWLRKFKLAFQIFGCKNQRELNQWFDASVWTTYEITREYCPLSAEMQAFMFYRGISCDVEITTPRNLEFLALWKQRRKKLLPACSCGNCRQRFWGLV